MARINSTTREILPNPSKVLRPGQELSHETIGTWAANTSHQAWNRLEITANQRIKITSGNNLISGVFEAQASGKLRLTIYAGAGESTVQLNGTWQIQGIELKLEFKAMDMHFVRVTT